MELSSEALQKIDTLIPRYPQTRSAILPILHLIQEEKRYIPKEAIQWVADKLGLQPIQVYEVVTFYPMFKESPEGRTHVKVCRTLSCALRGGYKVCETLQKKLGCKLGETTPDGAFSIEFVECQASCMTAPVVVVNETYHHNITPEKAEAFADELKAQAKETV